MESRSKTSLLLLPLALLCVCAAGDENCPSVPDNISTELTCHSDFDQTITCLWNSTSVSDRPDNVCKILAERESVNFNSYSSSCRLEPVDASRPTLKKCLLFFNRSKRVSLFLIKHFLSLNLSCDPGKQALSLSFKPACHIKLQPPPRPDVNFTTVSWFAQVTKHRAIGFYSSQLQWKHEDQSWMDPSVQKNILTGENKWNFTKELAEEQLIRGERYDARVRVKALQDRMKSIWSDWSPVASWESAVGRTKERPSDLHVGVLAMVGAAAAFAVFLVVIRFKTDKTTWVYMVKRIRGPPLPNPAKSFLKDVNFQNWSPHFSDESFHSLFKPVEVVSVEVTSAVDAVAPLGPEAALLEKIRSESSYNSTSSNFSNPIYTHLCPPPPPVSSLTAGSLAACATDTPYGPVGGHDEKAEQEARGKEVEIRLLLSKGGNDSESMPMVSDYERAEKIQMERARLQSLDSGVCSGEEVSQESLEADSINTGEGEEESEGGSDKEVDFQKLFGGDGGVFHKGSIQVCSGYERVETPQPDGRELLSMDSGVSGVGEEQVSQEDVDQSSESTCLLSPPPLPPPCSSSPSFPPLFTPRPLDLCGSGSSPALSIALMSTSRSVEPSGDGYM